MVHSFDFMSEDGWSDNILKSPGNLAPASVGKLSGAGWERNNSRPVLFMVEVRLNSFYFKSSPNVSTARGVFLSATWGRVE